MTDAGLSGVTLILAERLRQINEEGWTPEHDDKHDAGELSGAAVCYANHATLLSISRKYPDSHFAEEIVPKGWPWSLDWWKPSGDPIEDLVKAGALIAAEIDRLQRRSEGRENYDPYEGRGGRLQEMIVEDDLRTYATEHEKTEEHF